MKNLFKIGAVLLLSLLSQFSYAQFGVELGGAIAGSFRPERGHKYIVSAWVKEIHSSAVATYANSDITISFKTPDEVAYTFNPTGNIIEGWQHITGILIIPGGLDATKIKIKLNNNSDTDVYFDDVRFFPYNGNLKSFVYDESTQRLLAELDENNYATFYEYDLEGGLVRVKKETENGIFTIQETRSNSAK